ncbi:hypothetical protein FA13DRAFT_294168 [Coprinellus micaceus]|uniref:Uncharacterized protein n=1 Tax=Coprinellus micaceus TaxID=71717 RepID=A0A4Y7TE45_COPMI|nr:hypothetical protein FA13DRAFT_294168 [Coprinellus micaceus]
MFLEVCTSLSEETQEEIMDVLLKINQDTLLKQLCARLPHIPMVNADFNQATVLDGTASAAAYILFTIPQFFDRLLINHEIVLSPCISNESLWAIKAKMNAKTPSSQLRWLFEVTEIRTRKHDPIGRTHYRSICVNIPEVGGDGKGGCPNPNCIHMGLSPSDRQTEVGPLRTPHRSPEDFP